MDTAAKLLSVLQLFTLERSEWTVEEAAAEIGVSVSTAYRYFRSLCKVGMLDPFNGNAYVLGPAIIDYDRQIRMNDPMIKTGKPVIQRMVARSGGIGVALLCRIYRQCVMCVHQEGEFSSRSGVSYERGRPMQMFKGASSRIIFANLPLPSVRWFFGKYPNEIAAAGLGSDWEAVKSNLRRIRRVGVLVAHSEVDRNRIGIAAPIFDSNRRVLGSVSMVLMENEVEAVPETVANVSALVDAAGREIHAALVNLHHRRAAESTHSGSSANDQSAIPDKISESAEQF